MALDFYSKDMIEKVTMQRAQQKTLLNLVFNKPRCHDNNTHLSQNARINSSVLNLDFCKKRANCLKVMVN